MKEISQGKLLTKWLIRALIILLIMMGMVYRHWFALIAFGLNLILLLFAEEEDLIAELFFVLPFASVYKYAPGSTSFVTMLELAAVLILFARKRTMPVNNYLILAVMWLAYLVCGEVFSRSLHLTELIKHAAGLLIIYYGIENKNLTAEKTIIALCCGLLISSVIALFADHIPHFYAYVRKIGYNPEITNRFTGMNGDPNYYSITLILCLLGAMMIRRKHPVFFWAMLAATGLFGFKTYSKSFFLIFLIVLLVILVELRKDHQKRSLAVFLSLIAVFTALTFMGRLSGVTSILFRLDQAENFSQLTTGRTDLWAKYLRVIFSDPLRSLVGGSLSARVIDGKGVHCFYLEMVYYFGLAGAALFFSTIFSAFLSAIRPNRASDAGLAAVSVIAIMYLFLQMLFSNELFFHLFYLILLCRYSAKPGQALSARTQPADPSAAGD